MRNNLFFLLAFLAISRPLALGETSYFEGITNPHSARGLYHSTHAPDNHLAMGNPSKAETSTSTPNNYLITKNEYVVSYNAAEGKPNWVSWHVDANWLGSFKRDAAHEPFGEDASIPQGLFRAGPGDFKGSGFDRGHNCPSADRTSSEADNAVTYNMTNMMAQAPSVNEHTWEGLEAYTRKLVKDKNQECYVICGSFGKGGAGKKGPLETIHNGKITVPAFCWKVVVVLPDASGDDAKRVNDHARVIAVMMPNKQGISTKWTDFITTVDAIEAKTNLDLLSAVPKAIQDIVEAHKDAGAL